ncbi:hypothetical protein CTEN210_12225 [Chaetoceros tenuissimus]|uniref:Uncharacterized protein n=1 Tax=Chaetoceros tenuissimus TaxID=426638 RepID=A0AAD3D130_9STRA|nr:hypothetical protein CTEN210_12225 [Chaetoceros tenuissimus]
MFRVKYLCCFALVASSEALTTPSSSHSHILRSPTSTSLSSNHSSLFAINGGSSQKLTLAQNIKSQYVQRVAADPNFLSKSVAEVLLAAGTQFIAEIGRRGKSNIIPEIDFVIAGIFTAIAGKYYSMWRVAPTLDQKDETKEVNYRDVPTNAFQTDQAYTLSQRGMAMLIPIPSLFRAGVIASTIGYGLTSILIALRSLLVPSYVAKTQNVNIVYASIYTGGFMAIVSNIRYQLLQGIIEPKIIEKLFAKFPVIKAAMIFLVRLGNGLLGSSIAIAGMKFFGLQKLK